MHESINIEFKHWREIQIENLLNYICAFLNTVGGWIFIGIDDDGIVRGIFLKRRQIDDLRLKLDNNLRKFYPHISSMDVIINFHWICLDESFEYLIKDNYIVEIEVKKGSGIYTN